MGMIRIVGLKLYNLNGAYGLSVRKINKLFKSTKILPVFPMTVILLTDAWWRDEHEKVWFPRLVVHRFTYVESQSLLLLQIIFYSWNN